VSSGNAARAQEICETVKELDCNLLMHFGFQQR